MAKRNIFGLIYDDKTGRVTYDDGEIPAVGGDFTFEQPEDFTGQLENPLQFATSKTGEKIVAILTESLPKDCKIKTFLYGDPPALMVGIERNGIRGEFNVGLIANSLIRSGSLNSFKQDLKIAGLLF